MEDRNNFQQYMATSTQRQTSFKLLQIFISPILPTGKGHVAERDPRVSVRTELGKSDPRVGDRTAETAAA